MALSLRKTAVLWNTCILCCVLADDAWRQAVTGVRNESNAENTEAPADESIPQMVWEDPKDIWLEAMSNFSIFNRPNTWKPKALVVSELYIIPGYESYKHGSKSLSGYMFRFKQALDNWLNSLEKQSLLSICIANDSRTLLQLLKVLRELKRKRPSVASHVWLEPIPLDPRAVAATRGIGPHCTRKSGQRLKYGVARDTAAVWLNKFSCLEAVTAKYTTLGAITEDTPVMWTDFGRFWVKPEYLSAYARELGNSSSRMSKEVDSHALPTIIWDTQTIYKVKEETAFNGKAIGPALFAAYWMAFRPKKLKGIFSALLEAAKPVAAGGSCYDEETVITYAGLHVKNVQLYALNHSDPNFRKELRLPPLKK